MVSIQQAPVAAATQENYFSGDEVKQIKEFAVYAHDLFGDVDGVRQGYACRGKASDFMKEMAANRYIFGKVAGVIMNNRQRSDRLPDEFLLGKMFKWANRYANTLYRQSLARTQAPA